MTLPHFNMTLPHPNMTLPHFLWQGHFCCVLGHFKVWQVHFYNMFLPQKMLAISFSLVAMSLLNVART
jgi:hypothetical protein